MSELNFALYPTFTLSSDNTNAVDAAIRKAVNDHHSIFSKEGITPAIADYCFVVEWDKSFEPRTGIMGETYFESSVWIHAVEDYLVNADNLDEVAEASMFFDIYHTNDTLFISPFLVELQKLFQVIQADADASAVRQTEAKPLFETNDLPVGVYPETPEDIAQEVAEAADEDARSNEAIAEENAKLRQEIEELKTKRKEEDAQAKEDYANRPDELEALTFIEWRMARGKVKGLTHRFMAGRLGMSASTVSRTLRKKHVKEAVKFITASLPAKKLFS